MCVYICYSVNLGLAEGGGIAAIASSYTINSTNVPHYLIPQEFFRISATQLLTQIRYRCMRSKTTTIESVHALRWNILILFPPSTLVKSDDSITYSILLLQT